MVSKYIVQSQQNKFLISDTAKSTVVKTKSKKSLSTPNWNISNLPQENDRKNKARPKPALSKDNEIPRTKQDLLATITYTERKRLSKNTLGSTNFKGVTERKQVTGPLNELQSIKLEEMHKNYLERTMPKRLKTPDIQNLVDLHRKRSSTKIGAMDIRKEELLT